MYADFAYSLDDYDYVLPPELIAQEPAPARDGSRLLVLNTCGAGPEHRRFHDLPRLFRAGDVLALNNTRVFPARLLGSKASGGRIELFLLGFPETEEASGQSEHCATARALLKSSKRARIGARLSFGPALQAEVTALHQDGTAGVRLWFPAGKRLEEVLADCGRMPLPPYITRTDESHRQQDSERYQTCYARYTGSVAAPTAGLHFTPELLAELERMGVIMAPLTLHVGYGTFAPVRTADIRAHPIHSEWVSVPAASAEAVNAAKKAGRRVWAVGTTSTRTLEFAAARGCGTEGPVAAFAGLCNLYIYPGFRFQVVDNLVTNFHLPKSSLLFLVAALAGRERTLAAYETAVRLRYRFFSYGDAMAIVTKS